MITMSKTLTVAAGSLLLFFGYRKVNDMTKKLGKDQKVVVVGGGYAGASLAYKLLNRGDVTLIDPRDAMHHNMSALRASVEPRFAPKSFMPYKPVFGDNFVQGKVVDIDTAAQEVILENNSKRIPYTELVIATGSSGPFPGKCSLESSSSELIKLYNDFTKEVAKAENIVIVGGGAVGVEMAGDIASDYPGEKKITIISSSDILVSPDLVDKAQQILREKFEKMNINLVTDDKVVNLNEIPRNKTSNPFTVKLASGKTLQADLVIPCFGLSVNSDAYKNSLGNVMNAKGQLKVNDKLQVEGNENIFAIGDCNDYDCTKLALLAKEQSDSTFENLIKIGKGKPLKPYQLSAFKMCVPVGREGGVSQVKTTVMGDFFTRQIKAKDAFVKFTWKEFGQKPPQ